MPNKEFLEKYPLYRKFEISREDGYYCDEFLRSLPKPAINIFCETCDSNQTFNMVNDYWELEENGRNAHAVGAIVRAHYKCSSCNQNEQFFYIKFSRTAFKQQEGEKEKMFSCFYAEKAGQSPAWSIETDKVLDELLGEHADYYKKGLICESQSYGIGAYAYFRRITEDIIDNLLGSILDLIEPSEKEKYKKALEETKKTKRTEDKIDLVKDLLPLSLKPNGMNPLKTLHSALSVGIHSRTDEECMEQAEIIKNVLIFLVNQILKTKEDKKKFTDGMKKLLEKK